MAAKKPQKAKLTQKALGILHPAEIRFLVIHAGIAEQLDAFRLDPKHWVKQLAGDAESKKKFLAVDLDSPEIKAYVYGVTPAIREASYLYIRALQSAIIVGGPPPVFEDLAAKLGQEPEDNIAAEKDSTDMRSMTRKRRSKKPPVTKAAEVEAPEDEVVETEVEEEAEEQEVSHPAGVGLNEAVDAILKDSQDNQESTAAAIVALNTRLDRIDAFQNTILAFLWNGSELDPADFPTTIEDLPSVGDIAEFLEEDPEE